MIRLKASHRRFIPKTYTTYILLGIGVILLFGWITSEGSTYDEDDDYQPPKIEFPKYSEFSKMAQEASSKDMNIILGLVDIDYIISAANFYVSSIKRHRIRNYMFVALHGSACSYLIRTFPEIRHKCFVFDDSKITNKTLYQTGHAKHFKERNYLRRVFILEALKLGLNVLFTDLDTVYFDNPLHDVKRSCGHCDIAAIWDNHLDTFDSGFMYVRPSDKSVSFFNRLASYELSHGSGQFAFNAALKHMRKKRSTSLKMVELSTKKYKVGALFFVQNMCPDPKSQTGVIVVHNNYILEPHNKIFRLKECMLWDFEGTDGYYSDLDRKYLTVDTPGPRGYLEHQTLLNAFAIAKILHRTLILPKIECKQVRCNLLMRMYDHTHMDFIKHFDYATVGNYRESSFLHNPRVPTSIKDSLSPIFHITFREDENRPLSHGQPVVHLVPRDTDKGPTHKEITDWFLPRTERVIRMDTLTGWFAHLKHAELVGEELVKIIRQL